MFFNIDDINKNCINKNRYIIYFNKLHDLMKIYGTLLKLEMNAKDGQCKC